MINRPKSHHSQYSLKYSKIRIIPRRTIHSKFNRFKNMQILCDHFFSSSGHHFRFILKGSAPKSTKNHYFRIVQCGNIQNPGQSLLMDFKKLSITDFYSMVTIVLIESILSRKFGAAQVITSTSYQSFSSSSFGWLVSVLNTVTSGV